MIIQCQWRHLTVNTLLAVYVAESIWKEVFKGDLYEEMRITSGDGGDHSVKSLHWSGNAFDIGMANIADSVRRHYTSRLRGSLNDDYDVVDEVTHVHVEYDPKGRHK